VQSVDKNVSARKTLRSRGRLEVKFSVPIASKSRPRTKPATEVSGSEVAGDVEAAVAGCAAVLTGAA